MDINWKEKEYERYLNLLIKTVCYSYLTLWWTSMPGGRRQWHPTPVLLPGQSRGRRSLVGCSPRGRTESERLSHCTFTFHFHALEKEMATNSSILAWRIPGLEAWWAAVYGVAQSRTWLTWLSSSSSVPGERSIRYADDTTLISESKEELKSLLMKVKGEGEEANLKLSIQKMKITLDNIHV